MNAARALSRKSHRLALKRTTNSRYHLEVSHTAAPSTNKLEVPLMHRKIDIYRRALAGDFAGHDDWLAAGQAAGYTGRRDIAGFFGGRDPSMVCLSDGRRRITSAGRRRAHRLGL